jgi:hypothetical protein
MKIFITALSIVLVLGLANAVAQNTFPATGNVGIGTTTPQNTLHVVGSSSGTVGSMNGYGGALIQNDAGPGWVAALGIQADKTASSRILFGDNAGLTRGQVIYYNSANSMQFMTNASTAQTIDSTGNVGIGTTAPSAKLEVDGNLKFTSGSGASVTYADGTVQATAWNGTTLGGDYAESIDVLGDRKAYEPGDVIVIDDSVTGKFDKSDKAYSKLVAGVYSTKPGLVGRRVTADRPDKAAEVPMAMMGIVPTKVTTENGPIERGDLLVSSSIPGYAMKGTDRDRLTGAVIGKALAPLKSGSGVVEVLLALQ